MQEENLRKGSWLEEEDSQLIAIVAVLGERRWDALAKASGLRRSGKSCRLRWMNYLRPNLKHGPISAEEDQLIFQLHQQWGNKWSRIARRLPGRTDNEIKNYWRSHLRKKAPVYEQENLSSAVDDTKQDECMSEKEDGISATSVKYSSEALELANFALANSRYEDWISCWSYEQNGMKNHGDECCSLGSCFSFQAWISEESDNASSTWDCYSSIWEMK